MATQIGPKIGIEGEKEYRAQIQQIIDQTKTLNSAMNVTTSTWDKNTSEMTKNKVQAQNLVKQISLMESKLALMNNMLNESTEKFGENDSKTRAWQRAIDNTTAAINNMKRQLDGLGNAQGFSDFATRIADVGKKIENVSAKLSAVGQKMTMSLTLPIVAAGTAAFKLASDLEESSNKVDVVFGDMSKGVKDFANDALNSYGLAKGSALQMAGAFGTMATSAGLSQEEAANMSIELTKLAADMASFYNISTDVAQNSLQGIFTGETEALKKYVGVMSQANLEEFASQQGKVYKSMSETEKMMTRYAFVMERTQDAQGDFARTSDGAANSLRTFTESCKNLGAALGEVLLPIITPIIQAITKVVQWISSLPEPVKKVIVVIALLIAAIGPVLSIVGSIGTAISQLITFIAGIPAAFGAATTAIAAFAAALGVPVAGLIAMAAAALLVGAAIGAIIAKWDDISAALGEFGNSVMDAYDKLMEENRELINNISNFSTEIVAYFKDLPNKIKQAIKEMVQQIKDEFNNLIRNAKQSGKDFIDGFVQGIKDRIQKVVDAVKNVAKTIEEYLGFSVPDKGPLHSYEKWMPDFMEGLAKGINENKSVVTRAINDLSKDMVLPLDASANMNMAMTTSDNSYSSGILGGFTMNVSVDHINDLNDLLRIQQQAQQRLRMGAI